MKIVICDDDVKDAKKAESFIKQMPSTEDFEVSIKEPQELYSEIEEGCFKSDILVIDIQFDGEKFDGIELTKGINEKLPTCQIIYLTNILDFAPFVYETTHCYFVMKENMEIMLPRAIDKAIANHGAMNNDIIEFLSNGHKVYTAQSEIKYIERNDRVLNIYALKKTYQCYTSLKKISGMLGEAFARCHGGFIVNLSYVSGIDGDKIYLKDGTEIPIGMRFYEDFKVKYLKYYSERM